MLSPHKRLRFRPHVLTLECIPMHHDHDFDREDNDYHAFEDFCPTDADIHHFFKSDDICRTLIESMGSTTG